MIQWTWANKERTSVKRTDERGVQHSASIHSAEVKEWLAAGGMPASEVPPPKKPGDVAEVLFVKRTETVILTGYYFEVAGQKIPWHSHVFEHHSVLAVGGLILRIRGESDCMLTEMGQSFLFPAGPEHELEATEPNTVCVQVQLLDRAA